jgi:outer membrane biosynthesis protein TonB
MCSKAQIAETSTAIPATIAAIISSRWRAKRQTETAANPPDRLRRDRGRGFRRFAYPRKARRLGRFGVIVVHLRLRSAVALP